MDAEALVLLGRARELCAQASLFISADVHGEHPMVGALCKGATDIDAFIAKHVAAQRDDGNPYEG